VTTVRVERLQDISGEDCMAEGVPMKRSLNDGPPLEGDIWWEAKDAYRGLWESINGKGSWTFNPWVWVIEFKQLHGPELSAALGDEGVKL
jgi:hypothetical protein